MSEYIYDWTPNKQNAKEPIVRCGNCISWFKDECRKHVYTTTIDGIEYDEGAFPMDASDFCSLGELRGDAE